VDRSYAFWESNGFRVVSAGPPDELFYETLFSIIESHDYIVSGTLSSAIFFAAAIGKTCRLLEDYTWSAYDLPSAYQDLARNWQLLSSTPRKFTEAVLSEKKQEYSTLASELLGDGLLASADDLKRQLCYAIEALKEPVFFGTRSSYPERKLVLLLSTWTGRGGLINRGLWRWLRWKVRPRVAVVTMREIDTWLNGLNEENFSLGEIKYVKNSTEPGWAAD
jgi:hypothetical protein